MNHAIRNVTSREMWHRLRSGIRDHIQLLMNVVLGLVVAVILLHIFVPTSIEWLGEATGLKDPFHAVTILTLVAVIVALERVFAIEDELLMKRNFILGSQRDLYHDVIEKIANHEIRADKIVFLQHSGTTVSQDISRLAEEIKGMEIELYQQDPASACLEGTAHLVRRIENVKSDIRYRDLGNKFKSRVTIKRFKPPASLRAMIVDKKIIVISWYLHLKTTNGLNVRGSENVGLYITDTASEFEKIHTSLLQSISTYDAECAARKEKLSENVEMQNC